MPTLYLRIALTHKKASILKPYAPEFDPKFGKAVSVRSVTSLKNNTGAKKQPEMSQFKPLDRTKLDGASGKHPCFSPWRSNS